MLGNNCAQLRRLGAPRGRPGEERERERCCQKVGRDQNRKGCEEAPGLYPRGNEGGRCSDLFFRKIVLMQRMDWRGTR